jgi:hypothetical protein
MNKLYLMIATLIFVTWFSANAIANDQPKSDAFYQEIIVLPGQTKLQIFEKSKQWIAKAFGSSKEVIKYENLQEGRIIGKGVVDYIGAIQGSIFGKREFIYLARFTITVDVKDGKSRVSFDQITGRNSTGEEIPDAYDPEGRLTQAIKDLTNMYKITISKTDTDNW